MRNLCHGLQQKLAPVLFAIVIINVVLFTFLSVPDLYKTSFIEKTRFNIPYSWQKYHNKQPANFKLPELDLKNIKNTQFLTNSESLLVELYKYALYAGCRTNDQSFTAYILTEPDNYEARDKFRTKWTENRPEVYDSESLIFVMVLEEFDDDEIPEKLFLEHRMHDDLLVIWNEPGIVEKPEISAILSHAAECEQNMEDYSRHILLTTDEYFWFSDSLESFILADVDYLPSELAVMIGDVNFGDEAHVLNGNLLPPKCSDGACVITKNAVQKLHEVSQELIGVKSEGKVEKKVIYFDDHMTYLSLLVHKINKNFEKGVDKQLKIQYHSDKRFWSWHESDTDKLTCLNFNFPMKIYGKYKDMCEA
jgi:hypothetical protein